MPSLALLAAIVILGFFLVSLLNGNAQHPWGDDWAQYVMHARNILTGHAYGDTGYLFNPDYPNVGPPTYPPGLPLLLIPALAAYGVNILALKFVCLICAALALSVAFRLLSAVVGQGAALITIFLLALHPYVWALGQEIASEAPFLLFTLLVLCLASRPIPRGAAGTAVGMLLGFLIFYSVSIRSIGIVLLPAIIVYGWAHRKPWAWLVAAVLTFTVLIWLQTNFLVRPTTYENELKVPTVGLIVGNMYGYLLALADWFPLPARLGAIAAAGTVFMATVGVWGVCTRPQPVANANGTGVRAIAARIPLVLWYLIFYMGALCLAALVPNPRYLLPVMPIFIGFSIVGGALILRRVAAPNWIAPAAVTLLAISFVASHAVLHFREANKVGSANCGPCMEMFAFVRTTTAPSSVVMFAKPRAMALFGGRHSWRPANRYTLEELQRKAKKMEVNTVVVGAPGSQFAKLYPLSAAEAQLIRGSETQLLFRNSMFEVVRLNAVEAAR